jgi:hypothetical protein
MKRWLRVAGLLLVLIVPGVVQAGDYAYTTNSGKITIIRYTGSGGSVAIPDAIDGLLVTSIEAFAFKDCVGLTSIMIPSSVKSIGTYAFSGCTRLSNIMIPTNVTSLENYVFKSCGLTNVMIPNSVTNIGDGAFSSCSNLVTVTVPNGVMNIGASAFIRCSNMTSVAIGYGVTNIGDTAFFRCVSLTNVAIPDGVVSLGASAFSDCYGLEKVTIGDTVTRIGQCAFYSCTSLTDVNFQGNAPPIVGGDVFGFDYLHSCPAKVYYLFGTKGWGSTFCGKYPEMLGNTAFITTVAVPATGGSVTGGGICGAGTVNRLIAKANGSWRFKQWQDGDTNATRHVLVDSDDVVYTATFVAAATLTVNASPTAGGTISGGGKYEMGDAASLIATSASGWRFKQWLDDATNTNPVRTVVVSKSATYTAQFQQLGSVVSISALPAAGVVTGSGIYDVGRQATLSVSVTNTDYAFSRWQDNQTMTARTVTVKAGTNIFTAYFGCLMTVRTNGIGTITPSYNAKVLEIGPRYSMTAVPSAGFAFVNWTDDAGIVVTNKPLVSFLMRTNLILRANFTDIAKPTVAVTAPTALQKVYGTTGDFTVRGTATDNLALSNVMVKVNGGSFVPAGPASTNGLKSWTLPVTLERGTNTIAAYSVDTTGNCSVTVTTKCVYVETGTLNITTNGPGKVTVSPTGALELNKTYTLTAAANAGAVFSNWTGDVVIGNPTGKVVKVTLNATNKTVAVAANFTDTAKPTVTITLPTANLRITNTNPVYTVKGTATDNSAVATVKVQLNSGDWTNAATTNAWKNWSAPVTLITGTNTIRAYSIDTAGNNSSTASVACIYPVVTIDVAAYANLSVGGRWNYKQTEGADISTQVLEVVETTIKNGHPIYLLQEYSAGGYPDDQFFWSSDFSAGLFDTGGLNDNGEPTETTFYWQPFMPKLFKTFVPGTEFTVNCAKSDMPGVVIIGKGKTVRERVTVPAGTYDCWKVTGSGTANGKPFGTEIAWYAENVGLVKRLQDGSLWELTSYVPPASADPMGIPSSGQDVASAPTPQAAIVVDGSSKDWVDIPCSTFSYSSVTQEVAVALDGNNIALLLNGCPFSTSDTVLVSFKLRLTYGVEDNRHTVDLWTSGSVLYGMVDGQAIAGLEAVLLNGVLEVKIPVEQVPSQVTIEEVGCGMDLGGGTLKELFRLTPSPASP